MKSGTGGCTYPISGKPEVGYDAVETNKALALFASGHTPCSATPDKGDFVAHIAGALALMRAPAGKAAPA